LESNSKPQIPKFQDFKSLKRELLHASGEVLTSNQPTLNLQGRSSAVTITKLLPVTGIAVKKLLVTPPKGCQGILNFK